MANNVDNNTAKQDLDWGDNEPKDLSGLGSVLFESVGPGGDRHVCLNACGLNQHAYYARHAVAGRSGRRAYDGSPQKHRPPPDYVPPTVTGGHVPPEVSAMLAASWGPGLNSTVTPSLRRDLSPGGSGFYPCSPEDTLRAQREEKQAEEYFHKHRRDGRLIVPRSQLMVGAPPTTGAVALDIAYGPPYQSFTMKHTRRLSFHTA